MTIFTDWSMIDPHYFYIRGALWGIVATTLFWTLFIPWLKRKLNKIKSNKRNAADT